MVPVWNSGKHCEQWEMLYPVWNSCKQIQFRFEVDTNVVPSLCSNLCYILAIKTSQVSEHLASYQFSIPQIEYPLGGSSKKGSHVYFLLIVAMLLLLWHQIVLLWHQVTRVASEEHLFQTIVLPRKLATGSIHDYLFCYCPLVGILFEVLRIECAVWSYVFLAITF